MVDEMTTEQVLKVYIALVCCLQEYHVKELYCNDQQDQS